jgi:hypothetical protein
MAGHAVLQWVRALVLGGVLMAASVTGHVAAGGVAPRVVVLLPVLGIITVCVAPFLDQPARGRRVAGLLVAGQVVLHLALPVLGGPDATASAHPGHGALMTSAEPSPWVHLGMLLAHFAAAVVVLVWLSAGERAAWTLLALAAAPVVAAWTFADDGWRRIVVVADVGLGRPGAPRADLCRPVCSTAGNGGGVSWRGPPRLYVD